MAIQNIIWDFDGVIVFSNEVREEGFHQIFSAYDENTRQKLIDYHRINGGLSRYVKIRYFYEEILGETITEEKIQQLAADFSVIMKKMLCRKEVLNPDWLTFMKGASSDITHHIASGSDQTELRFLCQELEIADYFQSIHGSPTPKNQLVEQILKANHYNKSQTILIGDAINDWDAATINSIGFRGYNNSDLKEKGNYINSFKNYDGN